MVDPCPHCGRDDFGNEGAREQHVLACERKAETAPARRQEAHPQPAGDVGQATGEALAVFDTDLDPGTRLGALQGLLGKAQGMVEGYNQYRRRKANEQENRLQHIDPEGEIELSVNCPRCNYEILPDEVPLKRDVMRCPGGCGKAIPIEQPQSA